MYATDPVRDRLLAVARDLFALRGYDGTSVRDITRRARANLGAITYHFGSKEALYHEVIASRVEPLVARVILAAAGIDVKDPSIRARIADHIATTVRRALAANLSMVP